VWRIADSGEISNSPHTGKREKVGKRYVSRIIRLAFLAPEIIEQIVKGCQPPELTAESLLKDRTQLPLQWESRAGCLDSPCWLDPSDRGPLIESLRCRSVEAFGRRGPLVRSSGGRQASAQSAEVHRQKSKQRESPRTAAESPK